MMQLGYRVNCPTSAYFPLSRATVPNLGNGLLQMDERLIKADFGQDELATAGVHSTYIPIGLDTESWRPPNGEERALLRRVRPDENTFVVLTVADNQERKNLSRSLEIFADFAKDHNAFIGW
jgi:hypothetical protein